MLVLFQIALDIDLEQFEKAQAKEGPLSFDLEDKDFSEESFTTNEDEHEKQAESSGLVYPQASENKETNSSPTPYKREGEKIGRNDPCPCGSGKKYKKCHGK